MSDEAINFPQRSRTKGLRALDGEGRTLPHSIEAEEYLLSCILLDGAAMMARCKQAGLHPAVFYDTRNEIIFGRLEVMWKKNVLIDISILAEEMRTAKELDAVGGYSYLTQISSRIPTTAQAGYFIDKVLEQAMLRAQIRSATVIVEECYNYSGDLEKLLSDHALDLQRRADFMSRLRQESLRTRMEARLAHTLDAAAGKVDSSRWIYTGLSGLDDTIKPWDVRREHWYNIIAGPPSGGKSSFMRQIAIHNVVNCGKRFAVFLLETGLMWTESAAATLAQVPLNAILEGTAPRDMLPRYEAEYRELIALADDRLFVFDDIYFVEDIERKVREIDRMLRERELTAAARIIDQEERELAIASVHGLDGVVVDYLQIVSTRENFRGHREQIVAHVNGALKRLFKKLNVPGFVGAQINRASREGPEAAKIPMLSALRESGTIEQDADSVIFVHTPPVTKAGVEQNGNNGVDEVEIGQRKRRNGVRDVAHGVLFHKAQTRYEEPAGGRANTRPGTPKPPGGYKRESAG